MPGVPTNVAQLMAVLSLNTAPFKAEAAAATGMMGATGPIAMAALGMGAVVAGVGVIATKMAGDFQAGLNSLVTGAGESQQNLKMVSDGILQMAKDTGTSTSQLISGMYMIESGGFHGAAGLNILKAAAEGAKVGNADLGVIADTTDTILKNFGEHGALTATQAVNALITTVANGKTHLEDLGSSLSGVLPAGAAAGLGLKDVLGAMAELTNVGIPAAEASTYLRQMIIALEAPSAGAVTALKRVGVTTDELAAHMKQGLPNALQFIESQLESHGIKPGTAQYVASLREISGGTRQMQGMLNLMGPHLADFADKVNKIGAASSKTGSQVTGWALVQTNMNQQFDRAREVAETLMIQLGQNLLPVMTNLFRFLADTGLPAIKNLVEFLTGTSAQAQVLRPVLAVLAIAIGGALVAAFIAWAVSAAAAAVATIAATWPILAIGAAIALLIAGIIFAVTHWRQITDAIGHFKDMIGSAPAPVKILLAVLFPIPALIALIVSHWTDITTALGHFKDMLGNLIAAIPGFVGGIVQWFANLQKSVEQKAHDMTVGVIQWFLHLQLGIAQHVHDAVEGAINKAKDFETRLIQKGHDIVTGFLSALAALPGKLLALGEQMIQQLGQGIRNGAHFVFDAVSSLPGIGGLYQQFASHIPHFATGGVMGSSGLALVGENGPELVYLPSGAQVSPSPAGGGAAGAGGYGSQPIVVNLVVDGKRLAQATVAHMPAVIRNATGRRNM